MDPVTTDLAVETPAGAALPLLLDAADAARFLGVGRTTFYQLDMTGLVPGAIRLSKIRRWSRPELRRWVEAGCPPRHRWGAAR